MIPIRPIRLIVFMSILLLAACSSNKKIAKSNHVTTDSAPYELLLIADKDWLKTADGTVVMEILNSDIPGLPQRESNFRIISINPTAFGKTFQGFANIIQMDINSKYPETSFKVAHDIYAHPQTIIYLNAPDGKSMAEMVIKRQYQIIDMFNNAELKRERASLRKTYSDKVKREVEKMFNCTIYAPKDINAVKKGKNFLWSSTNQIDNRLNICVYSYPYTPEDYSEQRFIAIRDSFMRENIKGNSTNQYMKTNAEYVYIRTKTFEGRTVIEARGLWEMENDMMGGPFVSYSQVDSVNNRVIVAEGFVYAPEKRKRLFIRQLEAAVQTLQFNQ